MTMQYKFTGDHFTKKILQMILPGKSIGEHFPQIIHWKLCYYEIILDMLLL